MLGFDTQAPTEQTSFTMDPDAQSIIIKAPEEPDYYYLFYRNIKGQLEFQKFSPEKGAIDFGQTLDETVDIGYSFAALEVDEYEEKAYLFYTTFENDPMAPSAQDNWLKVIEFTENSIGTPVTLSTKLGADSRELGEIQVSADGNYIAWMSNISEKSLTARRIFVEKLNNDYLSTTSYDELNVESLDPDNHISLDFAPDGKHLIFSVENCASSSDDGLYAYNFANLENYEQISTSVTGTVRKTYDGDIAVAKAGGTSLYTLADGDPDNLLLSESLGTEDLTGLLPTQVVRINYEYPEPLLAHRSVGKKRYELTDHLGNVRTVVSDLKITTLSSTGAVGAFAATVKQANDYYPFGSLLYGRDVSAGSEDYRFGFNGKESDSEWQNTSGSIYDYGFRIYNPRIGKFLSVDPLAGSYPWYTPYQFSGNSPIRFIDLDGLEEADPQQIKAAEQYWKKTKLNQSEFFPNITPKQINDQVHSRIRSLGENINQGKFFLCGPAAASHIAASHDPRGYVQTVFDLYMKGFANGKAVKGNAPIYNAQPDKNGNIDGIAAVDWILMHSLRYSENSIDWGGYDPHSKDDFNKMTLKSEFDDLVNRLGSNVSFPTSNKSISSARDLNALSDWIGEGKRAVLFINSRAYRGQDSGTGLDGWVSRNYGRHFVVLKGITQSESGSVTLNYWDYGNRGLKTKSFESFEDFQSSTFNYWLINNDGQNE